MANYGQNARLRVLRALISQIGQYLVNILPSYALFISRLSNDISDLQAPLAKLLISLTKT